MHHDWYIFFAVVVVGTYCIQRYVRYYNEQLNRRPH